MRLLAIDPGPQESAAVEYDTELGIPVGHVKWPNHELRHMKWPNHELRHWVAMETYADTLAIEMIASYGMPVGREVFETCVWIGRLIEAWQGGHHHLVTKRPPPMLVYRRDVKLHLCGSARAKDSNVRQALIDRYGPGKDRAIGRKATPGPLYGLTGDCWAALAVAVTVADGATQGVKEAAA